MPKAKSPPVIDPALVMVLLLPADDAAGREAPADVPTWIVPRLSTVLLSSTKMPTAWALTASPTVIVPVAALVMVFWLPAEMPVPSSPALTAPLLVTVLRSFTPIAMPPMLLTVAPVCTLTVS